MTGIIKNAEPHQIWLVELENGKELKTWWDR